MWRQSAFNQGGGARQRHAVVAGNIHFLLEGNWDFEVAFFIFYWRFITSAHTSAGCSGLW